MWDTVIMAAGFGLTIPIVIQILSRPKAPRKSCFLTASLLAVIALGFAMLALWQSFISYMANVILFTILGLQRRR